MSNKEEMTVLGITFYIFSALVISVAIGFACNAELGWIASGMFGLVFSCYCLSKADEEE